MAKRIAGTFRIGDEELAAELLMRLTELKAKDLAGIRRWKAYLVRSLYNAAKNYIRHDDVLHRRFKSMGGGAEGEDCHAPSFEERLAAPEEPLELRLDLAKVWNILTPEMRELWHLLVEHGGNTSSVAKMLKRPRKTVEYWIQKLRAVLERHGMH